MTGEAKHHQIRCQLGGPTGALMHVQSIDQPIRTKQDGGVTELVAPMSLPELLVLRAEIDAVINRVAAAVVGE